MTFPPHVAALLGLLYPEDEDTTILRNVGNYPTTQCNISEDPKSTKLPVLRPSSSHCKFDSIEKILIFHEYLMNIGLISFEKEYTTCEDVTNSFHILYCCSVVRRIYALYRVGQQYLTEFEERERERDRERELMEGNV
jgi:hypothetical protein